MNDRDEKEWSELLSITRDASIVVDRVQIKESGIRIKGPFNLPPLAKLSDKDQAFVTAFVCCHGSIKQMEKYFGVSYPTIKNRLKEVSEQLDFVDIAPKTSRAEVLDKLEAGEITADEAINLLRQD